MGDPGGGSIPESGVLGRAFVIIWPPSRWGFLDIPATFEQPRLNASSAAAGGSSAVLEAALDNGTPVRPAASPLPLALGFAGAVPITWLQRRVRARRVTAGPLSLNAKRVAGTGAESVPRAGALLRPRSPYHA